MRIEVELQVDKQGQLNIPDEIQRHLFPGMLVVLKLEDATTDVSGIGHKPNGIAEAECQSPGLVRENGILVFRGAIEEGFDWDAFMQEGREAPLHPFEPELQ